MTTSRGFTLIETVVYLGLFSILMGGLIVSAFYLVDAGGKGAERIALQEQGTFVARKLAYAVSGASEASVSSAGTLILVRPDLPTSEDPLTFSVSEGVMYLARGTRDPLPLTSSRYRVENVAMSVTHTQGEAAKVTVSYTVEGIPFFFEAYLRN